MRLKEDERCRYLRFTCMLLPNLYAIARGRICWAGSVYYVGTLPGFHLSCELILIICCAIPDNNEELGIELYSFQLDEFSCSFSIIFKEVGRIQCLGPIAAGGLVLVHGNVDTSCSDFGLIMVYFIFLIYFLVLEMILKPV